MQKVLPFEGYSFTIDLNQWNEWKGWTENILSKSSLGNDKKSKCFDGTYFNLEYANKRSAGFSCDEDAINAFSKYIEQDILTPVHELR